MKNNRLPLGLGPIVLGLYGNLPITFNSLSWCLSVPNFNTVPPNKLNWTVILVVIAASTTAASSWAAKIHRGLFLKSSTDINPWSQSFFSLFRANSLSSSIEMLYFGVISGSSERILRNFALFSWLSWSRRNVICDTSNDAFPHSSLSLYGSSSNSSCSFGEFSCAEAADSEKLRVLWKLGRYWDCLFWASLLDRMLCTQRALRRETVARVRLNPLATSALAESMTKLERADALKTFLHR